jgi:signal transduction histidine kinase/CheY-like chemotaxis protein
MPDTEGTHSTWLDLDKTRLFAFDRLQSIIENINRVSSVEQRLKVLLHAALRDIPPAQRGAVYLSTPASHAFTVGAAFPHEPDLVGSEIDARGGYIEAAACVQCPVLIADAQQEGLVAFPGYADETWPVMSALVAPFVIGGQTVGVLALENCTKTHAFTQEHLSFVSLLSDYTAMTINNARLQTTQLTKPSGQPSILGLFYDLAAHIPVSLLLVDQHRHYVWANSAFCRMTGLTREELETVPSQTRKFFPQDPDVFTHKMDGDFFDLQLPRPSDTPCPVKATFLQPNALGIQGVEGYIGIFQDVSEKVSLERQIFHMQRLSNIGALVSSIVHELNNPLTTVLGFAELALLKNDIPDEAREDLEAIARQAQQSRCIVRDLLNYVHYQPESLTHIDINEQIRQLVHFRTCALRARELDIQLDLAASLPLLLGNARQLQQVIFNLINNADQACSLVNRKGKLRIRTRVAGKGRHIRISVSDNGPGIPAEIRQRIFEPFFTTKLPGEGTGLGLSISQQIIEQHRGRIWLESEEGKGATFVIDLPTSPDSETNQRGTLPKLAEQEDTVPARILVVDDETSIRHMLTKVLTKQAHNVDIARNGDEALQKLQEMDYDIVFLDLKLPGRPGKVIYNWIKQHRTELVKRTVIVTGDTLSDETTAFLKKEHIAYLLKPFELTELRTIIKRVWP